MEGMRLIALLLLLAGCRCENDATPRKKPGVKPPPAIEWKSAAYGHIQVSLPTTWLEDHRPMGNQYFFFGPKVDGFKPNFQIEWKKSALTIDRWAVINREKHDHSGGHATVHEKGWTKVGGRRAYYMVYEQLSRDPGRDNSKARFSTIDWYIQYDGHIGMLRGLSRQESFAFEYRPLFEQIVARVRYVTPK